MHERGSGIQPSHGKRVDALFLGPAFMLRARGDAGPVVQDFEVNQAITVETATATVMESAA